MLYKLVKNSLIAVSCQFRITGALGLENVLCKVSKVGYFVLPPCIVSPVVPLAGEIVEIAVELCALFGVDLRAVFLDVTCGQSVEADRPSFVFFTVSREAFRFSDYQVVVDFKFIPAVRAHKSLEAVAIYVSASYLDRRSQRSSDKGCSDQGN